VIVRLALFLRQLLKQPLKVASTSEELFDLFEDKCACSKSTRPSPRQTKRAESLKASP
jgi:hypothetical protein